MTIVRGTEREKHIISSFVFGNLDNGEKSRVVEDDFEPLVKKIGNSEEIIKYPPQQRNGESREEIERRDKMISSLLEKSDLLSHELVKVQAKLTNQEALFRDEMKRIKDDAYAKGLNDGVAKAQKDVESFYNSKLEQLSESISKLENLSEEVSSLTNGIEKELVHTSIDIAKEVLNSEITYNSGQVAINLSRSLIKKIDDAKEIKIRVNRSDYEILKIGLKDLENVEVVPDGAVTKGGVIIISDVGTIEGNIMERYKKIRERVLAKIDD
jgi:flagellar assembly protein FliH